MIPGVSKKQTLLIVIDTTLSALRILRMVWGHQADFNRIHQLTLVKYPNPENKDGGEFGIEWERLLKKSNKRHWTMWNIYKTHISNSLDKYNIVLKDGVTDVDVAHMVMSSTAKSFGNMMMLTMLSDVAGDSPITKAINIFRKEKLMGMASTMAMASLETPESN